MATTFPFRVVVMPSRGPKTIYILARAQTVEAAKDEAWEVVQRWHGATCRYVVEANA